jgi:selenocysteine lyase/cysteine desulfurase
VGIFFARREAQHLLKPLVVAAGWEDRSIRRLENYNTRNLPEVLGLGAALDFQRLIGPARAQRRILGLTQRLREELAGDPRFAIKTPAPGTLSAGITTVEVVGREAREMATTLSERHRIDCRPVSSHGLNGLRISLSVFNSEDQVELLLQGMREPA